MCEKLEIGLEKNFFKIEKFFKNFYFKNRCKNELDDGNEKINCRFTDTVFHDIDYTAYGHQRDRPPALDLIIKIEISINLPQSNQAKLGNGRSWPCYHKS